MKTHGSLLFGVSLAVVGASLVACGSGPIGPEGAAGPDGPDGPAGAVGSAGKVGAPGKAGPAGASGKAGATGPQGAPAPKPKVAPGAVYTQSNDTTSNEIFVYDRASAGTLTPHGAYPTGGIGTGAGLGDQGALAYSSDKGAVFAVNAGDNSISMLAIQDDGSLSLVSKISAGGVSPISVTVSGDYLYVVNAGDSSTAANISGFQIDPAGLSALAGSTQLLSAANPGPAQIAFTPNGGLLVVSEKGTNMIDTFVVNAGVAGSPDVQASAGMTPFGFAFGAGGQLVVSEAFGGTTGASAASSYTLSASGTITAVSSSIPDSQSAACWAVVAGAYAYVSNAHSNNLSSYSVAADGSLGLIGSGAAVTTGNGPIDMAVTPAGDFLYEINSMDASLGVFSISSTDGTLTKVGADFAGLPQTAAGLVAR